jgi:formylglycine-generating enzyme required for sulfatase activity
MKVVISLIFSYLVISPVSYFFSNENNDFEPYEFSFQQKIQSIEMIPVTGGELDLGRYHDKAVISDFWIGKYEITWKQYEAFVYGEIEKKTYDDNVMEKLGIDGISGATSPYTDMSKGMGKDQFPAINMTQYGALMFCKWLSALTGDFYRLPTEAEWEYACKMGEKGLDSQSLEDYAHFQKNSNYTYKEVGSYKKDALGLNDMKGNVAEWMMDQFVNDFYPQISGKKDPWTRPDELYPKVVRGGSWREEASDCQCSSRRASSRTWKKQDPQIPKSLWWNTNADYVGFRIVRPRVVPRKEEISKYWLEPIEDYN